MILAAHYSPAEFGTHEPRVYVATRAARFWRIEIEWQRDGQPNTITVHAADKMRLGEVVEYAREELLKQLPDGTPVETATMKFWCGR